MIIIRIRSNEAMQIATLLLAKLHFSGSALYTVAISLFDDIRPVIRKFLHTETVYLQILQIL